MKTKQWSGWRCLYSVNDDKHNTHGLAVYRVYREEQSSQSGEPYVPEHDPGAYVCKHERRGGMQAHICDMVSNRI